MALSRIIHCNLCNFIIFLVKQINVFGSICVHWFIYSLMYVKFAGWFDSIPGQRLWSIVLSAWLGWVEQKHPNVKICFFFFFSGRGQLCPGTREMFQGVQNLAMSERIPRGKSHRYSCVFFWLRVTELG